MTSTLVKKLNLRAMAEAEAASWRNLLPPEPWAQAVSAQPGYFARWVSSRLQAAHRNAPGWVVDARKAHQAFRPVPIVGVAERIALRALTEYVLAEEELPARSQEDYRAFVSGPISYAFREGGTRKLSDASVEYVVQADIASCYQYIDHGVLLTELENRTGKIEESRILIELLGEIQGATYGLPQLLDSSDKLAEVYMQVLERDVVRRIGQVWRFNDDFRLAVNGYGNAQQALEDLAAAARPLGLVLNDQKSHITLFTNYFWRHFTGESDDPDVEVNPSEIEVWVEDYPDLDDEELSEAAASALQRLDEGSEDPMDLSQVDAEDVKSLRWAFNYLAKQQSEDGLPYVDRVFAFVPQLTPRLCDYMVAAFKGGHSIGPVWGALSARSHVQNSWQRAWLTYVARTCGLRSNGEPLQWLQEQLRTAPHGLLHAELTLTLAEAGSMTFLEVDTALRTQPEALAPWYALAMNHVEASEEQRAAVRGSSKLYELLMPLPQAVAQS